MSRAVRRKHVQLEALQDDFSVPTENQQIVRVLSSRGNNLLEVISSDSSTFLVSMPTKFRKNMWIRRGNFVLVEPIEEGDKVKAEITRILTNQHIKYFKQDNVWPKEFMDKEEQKVSDNEAHFENTNRPIIREEDSESTNSDDDSEECSLDDPDSSNEKSTDLKT